MLTGKKVFRVFLVLLKNSLHLVNEFNVTA